MTELDRWKNDNLKHKEYNFCCTIGSREPKLYVDLGLNNSSVVIDAGGYVGEWSFLIDKLYRSPTIYVLEPANEFYNKCVKILDKRNFIVVNCGIGNKLCDEIYLNKNSTSLFVKNNKPEKVVIMDVDEFLNKFKILTVDLIKINIEGSEYDLLESIINKNIQHKFKSILVQFHNLFNDSEERMDNILAKFKQTHDVIYDYEFVWTYLKIK